MGAARMQFRDVCELTEREREVATLIAKGWNNPRIARELEISRETVKSHVSNILSKMGIESRAQVRVNGGRIYATR